MLDLVSNFQEQVVGEVPNLLYFSSAFSHAVLIGIMPPLAFVLFGKLIPGMTRDLFSAGRLFFVGFMFAIIAMPLKTGYVVYDATLIVISLFVAALLFFWAEEV